MSFYLLPILFATELSSGDMFWKNSKIFGSCDLHFVQDNIIHPKSTSLYFANNGNHPKYIPFLLESLFYNETGITKKNKFWTKEGSPNYNRIRKITNISPLITLLDLKLGISIQGVPSSYKLLGKIIHYINPSFIFALVKNPSPEYYRNYAEHSGLAKLFLFSKNKPIIYIPCLVCDSSPFQLEFGNHVDVSLATLSTIWDSLNGKNMKKKNLIVHYFELISPKCGVNLKNFGSRDDPFYCMIYSLGQIYNFTIASGNAP